MQLNELYNNTENKIKFDLLCSEKKLSNNQKKAIELALNGSFTLKDFMKICPNISKRTLQRDLLHLQKLQLIEAEGHTTNRKYHLKSFQFL